MPTRGSKGRGLARGQGDSMSPPLGVYFSPPDRVGTHLITVHFAQLSTGDPYLKTLKTLKALGRLKAFIHEGLQDYMTTFSHHEGDIFSP